MAAKSPYRSLFIVFFSSFVAIFTVFGALEDPETADQKPFTYGEKEAEGPKKWGAIKPEWRVCNNGKLQSPIDMINERVKVLHSLGALKVKKYKGASATLTNRGHDIASEWKGDAGGVEINGTDYKLVTIHWHSPSEHTVNGTSYAVEGHMVHRSADSGIAVIGILCKIVRPDPFIAKFLPEITTMTEKAADVGIVHPKASSLIERSITDILVPSQLPHAQKVKTVSRTQLHALRDAVYDGYETNARPVQNVNGRTIYLATTNEVSLF